MFKLKHVLWASFHVAGTGFLACGPGHAQCARKSTCSSVSALSCVAAWPRLILGIDIWNLPSKYINVKIDLTKFGNPLRLINNCTGASYSSGSTVQCWTETGLLFVGLCWFSSTVTLHDQAVTSLRFCVIWPVTYVQIEPFGTACDLQRLGDCFCWTHPC